MMSKFPSLENMDCLKDAPDPYRTIMQFSHFLTTAIYILAFYLLIFKISNQSLLAYRKVLIWYTAGNLASEIYISSFMLPVTYLPALVFRSAGYAKFFNISGLVQFYILDVCILHTVFSILHLFRFRFEVAITETTLSKKIMLRALYSFYFVSFLTLFFSFGTTPMSLPKQNEYKAKLYEENSEVSEEIFCYTSVIAPPLLDAVFTPLLVLYTILIILALFLVFFSFYHITKRLEHLSRHLSKKTIQLQKALLISIFIQASIHGVMLAIPIFFFMYAIMFNLYENNIAFALLVLISLHGSASTVAMIIFTKPLRVEAIQMARKLMTNSSKIGEKVHVLRPSIGVSEMSLYIDMKTRK